MKNIVLLTFDSLRADHCGYAGYTRNTTPTIDSLAEEGLLFRDANAPASRTNPSMSTIFTGETIRNRGRVSNPENSRRHIARHGTIAQDLSERGYTTGAFNPNAYASRYYGFDIGFDHFEDFLFQSESYRRLFSNHLNGSSMFTTFRNLRNYVRREEAFRTWDTYIDDIEEWVRAQREPFFLWAFSMDTHFPYLTPRSHRTWSNVLDQYYYNWKRNQLIDEFDIELSSRTHKKLVDIYDDSIRYANQFVAELRDRLEEFDPIFVIHADHGEAFGERGVYGHFYPSLYEEHIDVPLVIYGTDRDDTITKPVSLRNLRWIINQLSDGYEFVPEEKIIHSLEHDGRRDRTVTAVKANKWKYVQVDGEDQTQELYDLEHNPNEQQNRFEDERCSELLAGYADRQLAHRRELTGIEEAIESLDEV